MKWDEYSEVIPGQTCTQKHTVSTNSSFSGLRDGRGFIEREWIDGTHEVDYPLGKEQKPLKEQWDKNLFFLFLLSTELVWLCFGGLKITHYKNIKTVHYISCPLKKGVGFFFALFYINPFTIYFTV